MNDVLREEIGDLRLFADPSGTAGTVGAALRRARGGGVAFPACRGGFVARC